MARQTSVVMRDFILFSKTGFPAISGRILPMFHRQLYSVTGSAVLSSRRESFMMRSDLASPAAVAKISLTARLADRNPSP
jgi:hypothetical protein